MDHTAQKANRRIGHEYHAGLIIDESRVVKKGKKLPLKMPNGILACQVRF
jgi:hypothetical protein